MRAYSRSLVLYSEHTFLIFQDGHGGRFRHRQLSRKVERLIIRYNTNIAGFDSQNPNAKGYDYTHML